MSGKLNQDIVSLFKSKFEDNCIHLLIEAYNLLKTSGREIIEESENNITAKIVGYMKKNPKRTDLQIHLERESYLDGESIYEGLEDADKSPRIDIKYSVWNSKIEIEFYMEAKNLAENNWKKGSTNSTVDANRLRKRYIETGLKNFTSGRYPNGCLLGYVVEGTSQKVVELINQILTTDKRKDEILLKHKNYGIDYHYLSKHKETSMPILKHFLLNLS